MKNKSATRALARGGRRRSSIAAACACMAGLLLSGNCAASQLPNMPIMYTSSYSSNERTAPGGGTDRSTSMNNTVNFNSLIPGSGGKRTPFNMNFSQSENKMPGNKSETTNIGFSVLMTMRNVNFTNVYSLVESRNTSGGATNEAKNESMGLGLGLNWRKMPSANMSFSQYRTDTIEAGSSMLTMSHRSGGANLSFTQMESNSSTPSAPDSKSKNTTFGISGKNIDKKHFMMTSSLNMMKQRAMSGGRDMSRSDNNNLSLSIMDGHIPKVPVSVNAGFSRNRQQSPGVAAAVQSSRNINVYSDFTAPMKVRTSMSYSTSASKSSGVTTNSTTATVSGRREINRHAAATYNNTMMKSSGAASTKSSSFGLNASAGATTMSARWGWNSTSGRQTTPGSRSTSMTMDASSRLPGNITVTQQFTTSKSDGNKAVSESTGANIPVGNGSQLLLNSSKRRTAFRKDASFGITASMALSRTTQVSTTFNRQIENGLTVGRMWSMSISVALPQRTTLNVGLSAQKDAQQTNLSTMMTLTGAL